VVYKIGLELFTAAGPGFVRDCVDQGNEVFLDLKLYDIPNTVAHTVNAIASLGVTYTTVHLAGGKKMLDAIPAGLDLKILGVSVLTSFSEADWKDTVLPITVAPEKVRATVLNYADVASSHPVVGGMVCSPYEVASIRSKHPDLFLLVPGIRPDGSSAQDQARVMTPGMAAKAGASMIVLGRPITQARDSRAVAELVLKELAENEK
jgi:orotidine-5'-phosphate decarboxylase